MHPPAAPSPGLGWAGAWSFELLVVLPLLLALRIYLGGFAKLRAERHRRATAARAACFAAGIAVLFLALCSPIHALAGVLLSVHMLQHLLLMWVAPPLLWLGAPQAPIVRGLPAAFARALLRGLAARPLARAARVLAHPATAWLAFVSVSWAWHVPALYERALRSDPVHHLEHASFLLAALLFWRPVVQPWPSRPVWPRWAMIPYLALADVANTILCAILTFSDRVLYPSYAELVRPGAVSALADQATAGALMWVPGSAIFLVAVGAIARELLEPARRGRAAQGALAVRRVDAA